MESSPFRFDAVKALRDMEEFTREVGGYPFLYADIFMTRKEFEDMFDLTGITQNIFNNVYICEIETNAFQPTKWCVRSTTR